MPKKTKTRLPTTDEFLAYHPIRQPFEWVVNEENRVCIKVPKFRHPIGKKLCAIIRKENLFDAWLDDIGSIIWQRCDGRKTVKEILTDVQKQFPNQQNLDQRLFLFLQQMYHLNYINFQ